MMTHTHTVVYDTCGDKDNSYAHFMTETWRIMKHFMTNAMRIMIYIYFVTKINHYECDLFWGVFFLESWKKKKKHDTESENWKYEMIHDYRSYIMGNWWNVCKLLMVYKQT